MKTIKISEQLHSLIKTYCIFNNCKIEEYIDKKLSTDQELREFSKQIKKIKVN